MLQGIVGWRNELNSVIVPVGYTGGPTPLKNDAAGQWKHTNRLDTRVGDVCVHTAAEKFNVYKMGF